MVGAHDVPRSTGSILLTCLPRAVTSSSRGSPRTRHLGVRSMRKWVLQSSPRLLLSQQPRPQPGNKIQHPSHLSKGAMLSRARPGPPTLQASRHLRQDRHGESGPPDVQEPRPSGVRLGCRPSLAHEASSVPFRRCLRLQWSLWLLHCSSGVPVVVRFLGRKQLPAIPCPLSCP